MSSDRIDDANNQVNAKAKSAMKIDASKSLAEHAALEQSTIASAPERPCKICGSASLPYDTIDYAKTCEAAQFFGGKSGIPVTYNRCKKCNFIFTNFADSFSGEDFERWIYNADYILVDPDFAERRPELNANFVKTMFGHMKSRIVGLDYGGGEGLTSALLRRDGWNYDSFDPFGAVSMTAENATRYNLCTSFEVLEHLADPATALSNLLKTTSPDDLILAIGTHLSDGNIDEKTRLSWWYAAPRNGHISLFSSASMRHLAAQHGLQYFRARPTLHLLTRGHSSSSLRRLMLRYMGNKALQKLARG